MKFRLLVVLAAIGLIFIGTVAPAAAKPTTGSFSTTLTVEPTLITDTDITISGTLNTTVTRFTVQDGRVIAIATAEGTLTATSPTLGTATLVVTGARAVLNATVDADCDTGQLTITNLRGVVQVQGTLTLNGTTYTVNETVPVSATSITYTATTNAQKSLICDIATLLGTSASPKALTDKLNTLLKKL